MFEERWTDKGGKEERMKGEKEWWKGGEKKGKIRKEGNEERCKGERRKGGQSGGLRVKAWELRGGSHGWRHWDGWYRWGWRDGSCRLEVTGWALQHGRGRRCKSAAAWVLRYVSHGVGVKVHQ